MTQKISQLVYCSQAAMRAAYLVKFGPKYEKLGTDFDFFHSKKRVKHEECIGSPHYIIVCIVWPELIPLCHVWLHKLYLSRYSGIWQCWEIFFFCVFNNFGLKHLISFILLHLVSACPPGSRDCHSFCQLSPSFQPRKKRIVSGNPPELQKYQVWVYNYVKFEINRVAKR